MLYQARKSYLSHFMITRTLEASEIATPFGSWDLPCL